MTGPGIASTAPRLSAILVVRDEAHCIERCLRSVRPIADEIIVLDSGSTDRTVEIARSFGAAVETADWPGFGRQKNRALDRASGEWVLAIDADEYLTPQLAASILAATASPQPGVNGYFIRFLATWCGRPVRFGDWGGKRHLRLFRRGKARFTDSPVHERVNCEPKFAQLDGLMIHNTIADEDEARVKTHLYAELGARLLRERGRGGVFQAALHGAWAFLRGFLIRSGWLDGATGWKVAWMSAKRTWLRYALAAEPIARQPAKLQAVLGMLLIADFDYSTGKEVSLWALYLLPVAYSAWHGGFHWGAAMSGGAGGLLWLVTLAVGHPFSSDLHLAFAIASAVSTYLVVAGLVHRIRALQFREANE